ncbi:AraC family transcriptional regulator [Paraburkholderia sp. LEh10]|uniref:AraC family transcriptional regulator n=1 Tax=Paraburkholderia sp. LEh10 TaxID=2821353 RepID=UPI001AE5B7C8|nr:AraC family transcriptional regulator [Paraburkholderia sp. LEh10]MBP0588575.1 AraC family transcriptional regulator [Paraburkholderia sp. LEh10]
MSRTTVENTRSESKESAQYGYLANAGVEVLHARFDRHRFAAHAHDTWAIGAVIRGAKDTMASLRQPVVVNAGEVYAIPPHVAHAGKSISDNGCEYLMLYVPDAQWRLQCAIHRVSPHALVQPATMRSAIAPFIQFAALSMQSPWMLSAWSGEWALFCEAVLGAVRHRSSAVPPAAIVADKRLRDARAYLHAYSGRNVSLDELALEASLSVSELCRRFTAAFGLSPHRYQLVLRLKTAKRLLLGGMTPSDVAAATGFADQSHLGRHFKAVFGVTPGAVSPRNSARTF